MSNLFQSISVRSDLPLVQSQAEVIQSSLEVSTRESTTEVSSLDKDPSCRIALPTKRDLLSFMSQKKSCGNSAQPKVSSPAVPSQKTDAAPGASCVASTQVPNAGCHVDGAGNSQLEDCLGENVRKFLIEEYGTEYQSQLDVAAVLSTTLSHAVENDPRGASTTKTVTMPQFLIPTPLAQVSTASCAATSEETTDYADESSAGFDSHTDDPDGNSEAFSLLSAVESFTSATKKHDPDDYFPSSKNPRLDIKPSKIEFSVSQSTSSYHKWKSSVSVPEELVKKLPKPAFQPRLPPELAQNNTGPQVLKSSLNINFKKQATTKAELRFNTLASEEEQNQATTIESASLQQADEKPPVKLVIKTLSRESKPQRVVIISCSSSVHREPGANRPNDDSDPDSCGHAPSAQATSQATCTASLTIPQNSSEKDSKSGQSRQGGKEHTQSISFCSMQPIIKVKRIDSNAANAENSSSSDFSTSATWRNLQDIFLKFCETQKSSKNVSEAVTSSEQTSTEKKDKSVRDRPTELKRLSDSSGYCAFSNIPDKRESSKIAALYQNALLALEDHPKSVTLESERPRKISSPQSKDLVSGNKHRIAFWRKNRAKRRQRLHRLKTIHSVHAKQPHLSKNGFVSLSQNLSKTGTTQLTPSVILDPLVAASFDRITREPTVDHLGRSSLHIAMTCNNDATLNFVIEIYKRKGNLDCKDNEGLTPLFHGCRLGNEKGVEFLLLAGASINDACPDTGNTSLHEATLQSSLPVVKLLLDFGADLTIKNKCGLAATELATSSVISEFLSSRLMTYSNLISPTKVRILHSDRKFPTVYVLKCPGAQKSVTPFVLKSELCNSLGVSPEYFNVQYSPSLRFSVLDNSVIASRIINPQLTASFEQSMLASESSTLVEVDDSFTRLFNEYTSSDFSHDLRVKYSLQASRASAPDSSSDTDQMTDDDFTDEDECEIRKDDVREINRSLKKLTVLRNNHGKRVTKFEDRSSLHEDNAQLHTEQVPVSRTYKSKYRSSSSNSLSFDGCNTSCLERTASNASSSSVSHASSAEENVNPVNQVFGSAIRSSVSLGTFIKTEPFEGLDFPDQEQRHRAGAEECTGVPTSTASGLHSYAKKVPDPGQYSVSRSKKSATPKDNKSDLSIFDDISDESDVGTLFSEQTASISPLTNLACSRRKSNPLVCTISRRPAESAETVSASATLIPQRKVPVSSETEKPTSVFRINILHRNPMASILVPPSKKIDDSLFASKKVFLNSKILSPLAMIRALKPAMSTIRETDSTMMGGGSAALETQVSSTTLVKSPAAASMDQAASPTKLAGPDVKQGSYKIVCFRENGSTVHSIGPLKSIKVVVDASKSASA